MAKIEDNIVPIKIAYLADFVSKKKRISLQEALVYIYSNPMFEALYDEEAKWWYLDTESLYIEFEKRRKAFSKAVEFKEFEFFVYCVERYSAWKKMTSFQTLALFENLGADDFIIDNFDLLHTQDITYVLEDIDRFIKRRR